MKQTIGIIGGGIVGSTAAYYLSRAGHRPLLFDDGTGQATKAAAGIINPWFSLRRNKPWYFLVSKGAEFYRAFMADLKEDGYPSDQIFQSDGSLMIRRSNKRYEEDLKTAEEKKQDSPSIGIVQTVDGHDYFPYLEPKTKATYVEGGGRVDGHKLINTLHQAILKSGGTIIKEWVTFNQLNKKLIIYTSTKDYSVDKLLLAAGAWLPQLLEPLGYDVDIHPQKGQLYSLYHLEWQNKNWPVVMPPGSADIIPFNDGRMIIGATHENDRGYDLIIDQLQLEQLRKEISNIAPELAEFPIENITVGTRAQTSSYEVLVGQIPNLDNVWAISGLGSSGLTSGPYLGYQWAQLILTGQWKINKQLFPIHRLIQSK